MVFVTKSILFIMFLWKIQPERSFFIFQMKKGMLYRPEKLTFKKVQKIGILVLVQKWQFFKLFF